MGAAIPYAVMLAAAGAQVYNQNQAIRRQDQQAAQGIQQQGRLQRQADERVGQEISQLEASNAEGERAQRLGDYMDTLRRNARAAENVQGYGERAAGLLSRIDAAGMQRQREGFGYGHLASDLGQIGRASAGDQFINDLRVRSIRRNPWVDMASGVAMSAAGGMVGRGGTDQPWAQSRYGEAGRSPISGVVVRNGGTGWQGDSAFGQWGQWAR
jgi:hypothetical protein